MSKVSAIYHIVFCTKDRLRTLNLRSIDSLYRYMWDRLKQHGCYLYRIGGIENHVHILVDVSPTISLSDMVMDLKAVSSAWIKSSGLFPEFESWARGYYAASVSFSDRDSVIEYIKNQVLHHYDVSWESEMEVLCGRIGKSMYGAELS
ncbi:MAG: IS200/IS605 family transposase [Duncaniella sp.]|nr:IS200/IS605 family transposase [Duncaniella sp.]